MIIGLWFLNYSKINSFSVRLTDLLDADPYAYTSFKQETTNVHELTNHNN
jgi:hypothetical protein